MLTKRPALNVVVFLMLVAAFSWIAYQFSEMPLVVGGAGLVLVLFLTAVWLLSASEKVKKKQKPNGLGDDTGMWQ